MPAIEVMERNQKTVLWAYVSRDEYGSPTVSSAVEIDVRWEVTNGLLMDPLGKPVAYDAWVVVGQEVSIGSIMWLGCLDDLPTTPTNLFTVVGNVAIPDIKNREVFRPILLVRYSDTLPTIV